MLQTNSFVALIVPKAMLVFGALVLVGCNVGERAHEPSLGRVDISLVDERECDAAIPCGSIDGSLSLRSFDGRTTVIVGSRELARGGVTRRKLPPGSYAVGWEPGISASEPEASTWLTTASQTLDVFSSGSTQLRLRTTRQPASQTVAGLDSRR